MWCVGIILSFCFTPTVGGGTDTYCHIASPIYWSAQDTRATKAAVDRHNRVWKATCGRRQ